MASSGEGGNNKGVEGEREQSEVAQGRERLGGYPGPAQSPNPPLPPSQGKGKLPHAQRWFYHSPALRLLGVTAVCEVVGHVWWCCGGYAVCMANVGGGGHKHPPDKITHQASAV
eukprot:Sspe_Gene.38058::Locus_18350_Transcript_1_1_Confidence_1.000_Length_599::g.38058::m.38058